MPKLTTSPQLPPPPVTYTLELSQAEAQSLMRCLNKSARLIASTGYTSSDESNIHPIWLALKHAGGLTHADD